MEQENIKKTKYCTRCVETKSIDEFGVNNTSPDKLQFYCKICIQKAAAISRRKRLRKQEGIGPKSQMTNDRVDKSVARRVIEYDEKGQVCLACHEYRLFRNFTKDPGSPSGKNPRCNKCIRIANAKRNHDQIADQHGWLQLNIETVLKTGVKRSGKMLFTIDSRTQLEFPIDTNYRKRLQKYFERTGVDKLEA